MSLISKLLDAWESWKYPEDKEMKKRIEKIEKEASTNLKLVKKVPAKVPPLGDPKLG